MVGKLWREMGKRIMVSVVCLTLLVGVWGCSQPSSPISMADNVLKSALTQSSSLEEVSPPVAIQQLRRSMSSDDPQIKIVGLKPDTTIDQTTASIRFNVDDFSVFKDPELALGPHLTVLLDGQLYTEVYDAKQNITLTDLKPGTHRVQVFASTPWHESLKTSGAFDQLSFNVFAPTQSKQMTVNQPILIYSQPEGAYGGEPILLDYILTSPTGETKPNSKVRVTINGDSFVTEEQPPLYLKGFKSGTNWIKVEVLGANGKAIANPASEVIQLVTLKPGGTDTLSKLMRGDLDAKNAEQIVSLESSQRRAEQKRAVLASPRPTPAPQPIEKKVEETPEIFVPVSPADNKIKPLPASPAVKPTPAKASVQPAPAVSDPTQQKVPVAPTQPVVSEPQPVAQKKPMLGSANARSTPKETPAKSTVEKDDPIQSFLSRFRSPSPAPHPLVSPEPKFVTPPDLVPEKLEKAKVSDRMTPSPTVSPSPSVTKIAVPSTPTVSKVPDFPKPVSAPTVPPSLEKKDIDKPNAEQQFPAIAWQKFLKFPKGEDQDPPKSETPSTPKPSPSPQVKPELLEPTPSLAPKIDFAASKTEKN